MSYSIPTHFVQQYGQNVQLLLQQSGGKLTKAVTIGHHVGKGAKVVEQVGPVKPVKNLPRHSDTPLISTPADARWVYPNDYDWSDMIDDQDKLRMLIDPQSAYAQNGANSMRRGQDDEILQAMYAIAFTGENGTTQTSFPAGQIVGVNVGGTASGLNLAKLRAARSLLMASGVDLETEQLFMAITSKEHDQLMSETAVISMDYNTKPVLVDGRVTAFMGFNFIHVEFSDSNSYDAAATLVSGGNNLVPAWVKSGIHLGIWNDVKTSVDRRPDKRNSTQIYITQTLGATRTEEKRVVQVVCNPAA